MKISQSTVHVHTHGEHQWLLKLHFFQSHCLLFQSKSLLKSWLLLHIEAHSYVNNQALNIPQNPLDCQNKNSLRMCELEHNS